MGAQSVELRQSRKRGLNDNANCLLRQYFSTRTDFLRYSRVHLKKAAHHLNERPHKALEFETRRSGVTAVLRRPVEIAVLIGGADKGGLNLLCLSGWLRCEMSIGEGICGDCGV